MPRLVAEASPAELARIARGLSLAVVADADLVALGVVVAAAVDGAVGARPAQVALALEVGTARALAVHARLVAAGKDAPFQRGRIASPIRPSRLLRHTPTHTDKRER